MQRSVRLVAAVCALAAAVLTIGGAGRAYADDPIADLAQPTLIPRPPVDDLDLTPQVPADQNPLVPAKSSSSGTSSAATSATVGPSNAPPYSESWYPTDYDLTHAKTEIKSMGESAPGHLWEVVFLEVGGWCTSNSTHIKPYNGSCSEDASDNYQVAYDLEWYLYGYETSTTHPGHTGQQSLTVAATTNNSEAVNDTTNANAQGKDWEKAINANLAAYASQLNNYNKSQGLPLRFYVEGGNDLEGGFGGPSPAIDWVNGFNAVDSAGIFMEDNGGYLGTCAAKSCWNTPVDHGWSAAQKYHTNWGATYDLGFPEIYDTGWPTYYKDLDTAANAVDMPRGTLPYGVPVWDGTMWGCGIAGISEPNPDQAWSDFSNGVGQQPFYSTLIHSLGKTC